MSELERYSLAEIADLINHRSSATVVNQNPGLDYLDIEGKAGKEVFGPLAKEGVCVTTVLPRENGARLWFTEIGE